MKKIIPFLIPLLFCLTKSYPQNVPSLLLEKNINSTFSIVAYDETAQEWGVAVATDNIYVGNSTIYIQPGVGAFSVIAETEPSYGVRGLAHLAAGKTVQDAILTVRQQDEQAHYRQVAGIDHEGTAYTFTGTALKYWKGNAGEIYGDGYVVMGNQLAPKVLSKMSESFENSEGSLAQRLLASLVAGQKTGGQLSGKQSAAIVVKGANNEWFNQIDLRVDHSKNPIKDLQVLMDYHYGRIRLNQAIFAFREGNSQRATQKLTEAEPMLAGWTGMYAKIAGLQAAMGNEDAAVDWIQKGLAENPNWSVNLPAFYFLREHADMKSIIQPDSFDLQDWESALGMLSNLGRELEVIVLGEELIQSKQESSYLNYLLGRSYFYEKEQEQAIKYLKKSLKMDDENVETRVLLNKIKKQ